jgi:hypothetical protein
MIWIGSHRHDNKHIIDQAWRRCPRSLWKNRNCGTEEPVPDQEWIDGLVHSAEVKKLGPTDWWGVKVFGAGYLLVPGPLLTYPRAATYEDFLEAADTSGKTGRERLLRIFPHYVERLLAERRRAESKE